MKKKLSEMSGTGGSAGFTPGTGDGVATKFAFNRRKLNTFGKGKKRKKNPYKLSSIMNEIRINNDVFNWDSFKVKYDVQYIGPNIDDSIVDMKHNQEGWEVYDLGKYFAYISNKLVIFPKNVFVGGWYGGDEDSHEMGKIFIPQIKQLYDSGEYKFYKVLPI